MHFIDKFRNELREYSTYFSGFHRFLHMNSDEFNFLLKAIAPRIFCVS